MQWPLGRLPSGGGIRCSPIYSQASKSSKHPCISTYTAQEQEIMVFDSVYKTSHLSHYSRGTVHQKQSLSTKSLNLDSNTTQFGLYKLKTPKLCVWELSLAMRPWTRVGDWRCTPELRVFLFINSQGGASRSQTPPHFHLEAEATVRKIIKSHETRVCEACLYSLLYILVLWYERLPWEAKGSFTSYRGTASGEGHS